VHDRTHLELPVPIRVSKPNERVKFTWEAYFFVPESFRLDAATYGKSSLHEDFKSYVRLAVPESHVGQLEPATIEIEKGLDRGTDATIVALRLFACRVQRVLAAELRRLEKRADSSASRAADLANRIALALAR